MSKEFEEAMELGRQIVSYNPNLYEIWDWISLELDYGGDWGGLKAGVRKALYERGLNDLYERRTLLDFAREIKNGHFSRDSWEKVLFFWNGPAIRSISTGKLEEGLKIKLYRHDEGDGTFIGGDEGEVEIWAEGKDPISCKWQWVYDEEKDESFGQTESPAELITRYNLTCEAIVVFLYIETEGGYLVDIEVYL